MVRAAGATEAEMDSLSAASVSGGAPGEGATSHEDWMLDCTVDLTTPKA